MRRDTVDDRMEVRCRAYTIITNHQLPTKCYSHSSMRVTPIRDPRLSKLTYEICQNPITNRVVYRVCQHAQRLHVTVRGFTIVNHEFFLFLALNHIKARNTPTYSRLLHTFTSVIARLASKLQRSEARTLEEFTM